MGFALSCPKNYIMSNELSIVTLLGHNRGCLQIRIEQEPNSELRIMTVYNNQILGIVSFLLPEHFEPSPFIESNNRMKDLIEAAERFLKIQGQGE